MFYRYKLPVRSVIGCIWQVLAAGFPIMITALMFPFPCSFKILTAKNILHQLIIFPVCTGPAAVEYIMKAAGGRKLVNPVCST